MVGRQFTGIEQQFNPAKIGVFIELLFDYNSGAADDIEFREADIHNHTSLAVSSCFDIHFIGSHRTTFYLQNAIAGSYAWIAYNVTSKELPMYAKVAIDQNIRRLSFLVQVNQSELGENIMFPEITSQLDEHHINYTIFKYYQFSQKKSDEKNIYKVLPGNFSTPIPAEENFYSELSMQSFFQVSTFLVASFFSFNQTFLDFRDL